jgi:hypothetical protein
MSATPSHMRELISTLTWLVTFRDQHPQARQHHPPVLRQTYRRVEGNVQVDGTRPMISQRRLVLVRGTDNRLRHVNAMGRL